MAECSQLSINLYQLQRLYIPQPGRLIDQCLSGKLRHANCKMLDVSTEYGC
jgi:hypothetical protein